VKTLVKRRQANAQKEARSEQSIGTEERTPVLRKDAAFFKQFRGLEE